MSSLDRLLNPATIAIAGVSADPGKHGARVLTNLLKLGYSGEIWGVNPGLPEIQGLQVVPSLRDLPSPPDLVVAAVPATVATELVAGCEGVGAVIVFASGYGETGRSGATAEKSLAEAALAAGTRLLGPNSAGLIRPDRGLAASFLTCLDRPADEIRSGPIAVVTQSGGIASFIHNLAAARSEGIAISISTGNEADVRLGEAIGAVSALDEVEVVVAVVETVRDGTDFISAVRSARGAGKHVIVCALGKGARSERLMESHTGALAVSEVIMHGVFETLGVAVAETPAEAYEMASVIARAGPLAGPRVGIVTHSGGVAILLSDLAERHQVTLPQPSDRLAALMSENLDHGSAANPLDMGGIIGGPSRFAGTVAGFADSGEYDAVLAVSTAHPPAHTHERVRSLLDLESAVPVVHLWMAGDQAGNGMQELRVNGRAITEEPRAAIRALAALARPAGPSNDPQPLPGDPEEWGIPPLAGVVVTSLEEAVAAAEETGYPVVMKVETDDISHKTEVGGVLLDRRNRLEVEEAYQAIASIADNVRARVQPFRPGLEMIVGGIVHESFGPMVSIGFGGVLTEMLGDVAFAPAPVDEDDARSMIDRLRGRSLLNGYRGTTPADVAELANIISLISRGIAGGDVATFEINPLIWDGQTWLAVDWLATP